MKKGDIWVVNFDPSVGHEFQKIRLAIVIQSDKINSNLVTLLPFSSKVHKKTEDDIFIPQTEQNRLLSDSIIKGTQISTFDKKRFLNFIGKAENKIVKEINSYLKKHLDL